MQQALHGWRQRMGGWGGAKPRPLFVRFLAYVRPYAWWVVAATVGGVVKFSVPLLVPQVTRFLVDGVLVNHALTQTQQTQRLLLSVGGVMLLFAVLWGPMVYVRHFYASKAGYQSVFDLRVDLYYRILRMSTSFYDRHKSGSIVSRLIGDIDQVMNLIGTALTNIWMDVVALLLIIAFLLNIDPAMTLVALVTFPPYLLWLRRVNGRIHRSSARVQEGVATLAGNVQEKIAGSRVVQVFSAEQHERAHFQAEAASLLSNEMQRARLQSVNTTVTQLLVELAPLLVLLYGGWRVIEGTLTLGEMVAVNLYLRALYVPLERFAELNVTFANSTAALRRVYDILDAAPDVADKPNAITLSAAEGRVVFEHVVFHHNGISGDRGGLNGVTLTVNPGERVALVGPSGGGKSTLVNLIPRFYDVQAGRVCLDGVDVRDATLASLRQNVSMVLQTPVLFSGTLRDNICYGRPDATDAEVVAACKAANAYDFIIALPQGFLTEVGEGGAFLSGGQRQRVTIARAFLKDPRVLILDEATSALDAESERRVQASLDALMQGRTTFIIAHRLSTIIHADRIVVIDAGRIVEQGTHADLMALGGLYHRLYAGETPVL